MAQRFQGRDDFEATIRILGEAEGGRRAGARNGIRWDICYADENPKDNLWMVWPDFLDEHGESRSEEDELPIGVPLPAKMLIVNQDFRYKFHWTKAKVGTRFYCHEGTKRVAEGIITRITHLFENRRPSDSELMGMTVNERLWVCGLHDEFDAAILQRKREAAIQVLSKVALTTNEAAYTVDSIFKNPSYYGF